MKQQLIMDWLLINILNIVQIRNNVLMLSPSAQQNKQQKVLFKLPKIQSKHNIQLPTRKKSSSTEKHLPPLRVEYIGPQKQNIDINLKAQNQRQISIKQGLQAIKKAQLKVKDLFGDPEATANIGGQLTNFQHKVDLNREIIKNYRNQNHIKIESNKIMDKIQRIYKNKSLTFKQNKIKQSKSIKQMEIQLNKGQHQLISSLQKNKNQEVLDFKSQRKVKTKNKVKMISKQKKNNSNTLFVSIKQILDNPIKNEKEKEKQKTPIFTIQQLQKKLKKLTQDNESQLPLNRKQSQNLRSNKQYKNPQQSVRDWMKVEFDSQKNELKCFKSNFDQEVNHIKILQQRSYKSIQNMVQNRKLLIQLNLRSQMKKK